MAAALMDELVEEVLVRLPLDDPALLVRAALVCKWWCRLVSGRGFRRRFREFHRTAPVLGVLCNTVGVEGCIARFVPTSSFRPRRADRRGWRALDARHGCVLLRSLRRSNGSQDLVVCEPITGEERDLPVAPRCRCIWNGAVLCAAGSSDGDDCDHDCHGGPFLVVVVGTDGIGPMVFVDVYSSEDNAWSEQASAQYTGSLVHWIQPSVLVGNALYFMLSRTEILEYNLCTQETSEVHLLPIPYRSNVLPITENGRLGFATVHKSTLYLWPREASPEGDAGWAQRRIIELKNLLPVHPRLTRAYVVGFVDVVSLIFVETNDGLFAIDLKSQLVQRVRMVLKECNGENVFPYVSFYTPAIGIAGAAST